MGLCLWIPALKIIFLIKNESSITMKISDKAQHIIDDITKDGTKLGDLRKIAKEIKKDNALAQELWDTGKLMPMLLAVLIFDTKKLDTATVDNLLNDIDKQQGSEEGSKRLQLADWLMANQLMKDKKLRALILSWQNDPLPLKRRIFWYYQGRLRWTGQTPPENTGELLHAIKENIASEAPEVQWVMNFAAGWIGVYDKQYRKECIAMGEKHGLYKDEFVHKNCTPSYLPQFIEIEANKRNL